MLSDLSPVLAVFGTPDIIESMVFGNVVAASQNVQLVT